VRRTGFSLAENLVLPRDDLAAQLLVGHIAVEQMERVGVHERGEQEAGDDGPYARSAREILAGDDADLGEVSSEILLVLGGTARVEERREVSPRLRPLEPEAELRFGDVVHPEPERAPAVNRRREPT